MSEILNRYDFALIFDVKDGNPNGAPDAGNLPRVDAETGEGLVTDVCLKRKVRNYVQLTMEGQPGYDIFVKEKAILNKLIEKTYADLGIDLKAKPANQADGTKRKKTGEAQGTEILAAREKMCNDYYDIRTFGAVLSSGAKAGQVRGPVQMTFARSVEPIIIAEHALTRVAVTTDAEAEDQNGTNHTMGRKNTVHYGLYVAYGFLSPALAKQTGFSEDDLNLLWNALVNMFEQDHSAARGLMSTQKLIIFKHDSALGNAPSHKLFDLINIQRKPDVAVPRKFADYSLTIDRNNCPAGVSIIEK